MKTDERMKKDGKQKTPFAWGYRWGVQTYRKYPKADKAEQKRLSEQIDGYKDEASNGIGRSWECAIGFMRGMRDAAIERKTRQQRK